MKKRKKKKKCAIYPCPEQAAFGFGLIAKNLCGPCFDSFSRSKLSATEWAVRRARFVERRENKRNKIVVARIPKFHADKIDEIVMAAPDNWTSRDDFMAYSHRLYKQLMRTQETILEFEEGYLKSTWPDEDKPDQHVVINTETDAMILAFMREALPSRKTLDAPTMYCWHRMPVKDEEECEEQHEITKRPNRKPETD